MTLRSCARGHLGVTAGWATHRCSFGGASLPLRVNMGVRGGCHSPSPWVDLNFHLRLLWTSGRLFANCGLGEGSGHCQPCVWWLLCDPGASVPNLSAALELVVVSGHGSVAGQRSLWKGPLSLHWSWCDPVMLGFSHGYLSSKTVLGHTGRWRLPNSTESRWAPAFRLLAAAPFAACPEAAAPPTPSRRGPARQSPPVLLFHGSDPPEEAAPARRPLSPGRCEYFRGPGASVPSRANERKAARACHSRDSGRGQGTGAGRPHRREPVGTIGQRRDRPPWECRDMGLALGWPGACRREVGAGRRCGLTGAAMCPRQT